MAIRSTLYNGTVVPDRALKDICDMSACGLKPDQLHRALVRPHQRIAYSPEMLEDVTYLPYQGDDGCTDKEVEDGVKETDLEQRDVYFEDVKRILDNEEELVKAAMRASASVPGIALFSMIGSKGCHLHEKMISKHICIQQRITCTSAHMRLIVFISHLQSSGNKTHARPTDDDLYISAAQDNDGSGSGIVRHMDGNRYEYKAVLDSEFTLQSRSPPNIGGGFGTRDPVRPQSAFARRQVPEGIGLGCKSQGNKFRPLSAGANVDLRVDSADDDLYRLEFTNADLSQVCACLLCMFLLVFVCTEVLFPCMKFQPWRREKTVGGQMAVVDVYFKLHRIHESEHVSRSGQKILILLEYGDGVLYLHLQVAIVLYLHFQVQAKVGGKERSSEELDEIFCVFDL